MNHEKESALSEKEPAFEVIIPENVREEAKQNMEHVLEVLRGDPKDPTSLIVVLERSGALAYEAVEAYAKARGISLPKALRLNIGREISDKYQNKANTDLVDFGGRVGAGQELPLRDADLDGYYDWLGENPEVRGIAQKLLVESRGYDAKKVAVFDDTIFQGVTLGATAPWVVREAFPDAKIGGVYLFDNGSWLSDIARATYPNLGSGGEELAARQAMKEEALEPKYRELHEKTILALRKLGEEMARG